MQERCCEVCGTSFISRRYSQIYCDQTCKTHALNARRIEKNRKTDRTLSPNPGMIAKRAAAIREGWKDGRPGIQDTVDDRRFSTPKPKPKKEFSQAKLVRRYITDGQFISAIRIASKWPRLGPTREAIEAAMTDLENVVLVDEAIEALKRHLNMGD